MMHEKPAREYLVTERQLDAAVETFGSYDEAYRHLGVTPDEVEFEPVAMPEAAAERPELPPIAVSLAERAMALEDIMTYLNKSNRLEGFKKSGGSARVARNMRSGVREWRPKFDDGLAVLIAADALRAHGYAEADIEVMRVAMQKDLNDEYGPGRAYASDRAAVVKKANRAA